MALIQHYIDGTTRDKVAVAIDRLKTFEPAEGYYLAFSGGKDSQCIYHLAVEAGVKFDAHYSITAIDPPELVQFIKRQYPDVVREKPELSMFQLILKKQAPPTRLMRFCCTELKERGGEGRICVTGIRWAESLKRKSRKPFEVITNSIKNRMLFDDNDEDRNLFENCAVKGKRVINPIIDWEDEDVWEYIHSRNLPYCTLYDEGFTRIGCIGCPMAGKSRRKEFARYPKYYNGYIKIFDKVVHLRKAAGKKCTWDNGEELMKWWLQEGEATQSVNDHQITLFDEDE